MKLYWRYGLFAALLITMLSLWPQLDLWWVRGSDYQGAYAYAQYDEDAYAQYLNGIIGRRPRRSDPLIELQGDQTPPESFFSIQFVQPFLLAKVARATGLSTRIIFILLSPLVAFLSTLIIFYLLVFFTGDARLAFCGSLFITCLGTLAGRDGFIPHLLNLKLIYSGLPFLRRYQPGLSFPLFFAFVLLIWQAVNQRNRRGWLASFAAGLVFAILVFSYFYMWTAAMAWFFVFVSLWFYAHHSEWRELLKRLLPVVIIGAITLVGYALMTTRLARTTAGATILELTHTPDRLRGPEVIGVVVLILLFLIVKKGVARWSDPLILLILSFALHIFLLFNQQILTGRMLQPFHYEIFIGNYVVLLALVLAFATFRRGLGMEKSLLSRRAFFWICVLSFVCGALEVRLNNRRYRDSNLARDALMPVTKRLNELTVTRGNDVDEREVLFSPDIFNVADNTAGFAPQALLWATHAAISPTLSEQERQERFFQHLYYSEVAPEELNRRLSVGKFSEICALYGYGRHVSSSTAHFNPVSEAEIEEKVRQYTEFIAAFDYRRASHPKLSWVVIPENIEMNFSNLDRWYVRDYEERIISYRLFRVKLRNPGGENQITQAK